MSLGLANRFNILQQSPHDFVQSAPSNDSSWEQPVYLFPSRYNVRAQTEDGRLILWNSYKGTMNVFQPEKVPAIERLLSQKGFRGKLEGVVKYLYDRGFIVKEGTSEYRRFQMDFGKQHYRDDKLELILLASEDCNFRCEYCYEDFARGTMLPEVREGVKNLVRNRAADLKSLNISWFGGEPLYGFQAIEDLAPFFLEVAEERSLRLSSNMTTNGFLLTPDIAEKLLAWKINSFQVTIDGAPEDHNKSRPARDGQGTFGAILANLTSLRERGDEFRVDIRVNYGPKTAAHISDFFELVEQRFRGDSRFKLRFVPVGQWGGTNDEQLDICGVDEASRIQDLLKAEANRRGLDVSDSIKNVKGVGAMVCYAARPFNFIIGASGKIMKCTVDLDKEDRNVVGSLTREGELLLDADKMARWVEPAFESDRKCQKCVILPVCQGMSCPLVRFESNKSPCIPLRLEAKKELRQLTALSSA